MGYSPWGRKELDTAERLHFHFSLSCTGEGNSNPLQCSCLENTRDGGAWWAAIYEVAQSQTRLKQLSSSSSNIPTSPNWVRFIGKSFTRVTLQSTLLKKTPSPFRLYLPVTGLCLCGTELWKCSLPTFTCQIRFEEKVPCSWILGKC